MNRELTFNSSHDLFLIIVPNLDIAPYLSSPYQLVSYFSIDNSACVSSLPTIQHAPSLKSSIKPVLQFLDSNVFHLTPSCPLIHCLLFPPCAQAIETRANWASQTASILLVANETVAPSPEAHLFSTLFHACHLQTQLTLLSLVQNLIPFQTMSFPVYPLPCVLLFYNLLLASSILEKYSTIFVTFLLN